MPGEVCLHAAQHLVAQDVAGAGLDVVGEAVFGALRGVGAADGLYAGLYLRDGAAAVGLAEVQVEGARGDHAGDVGDIAVLTPAGDVVGEAVDQVGAFHGGVGGHAAIGGERLQPGLPRPDEPGVRGAHGVAVAAEAAGVHFRPACDQVHRAAHVEDVFPGQAFARDDVHGEEVVLEVAPAQPAALSALAEAGRVGAEDDV